MIRTPSCFYLALELGERFGGGIVECRAARPLWLPYFEVERVAEATKRARRLGASVPFGPGEDPSGWRSVVATPEAGEVALWERRR